MMKLHSENENMIYPGRKSDNLKFMNLSIYSLTIANIKTISPYFSQSQSHQSIHNTFSNLYLSFSKNNAFFINNQQSHTKIIKSKFNKFINSVIRVDTESLSNMIQNSKFQTTSTELDVIKTSFINCDSKGKGGSISLLSPCTFSCVETRFINSSSSESGGAIYGLIKMMVLSKICFLNCSTTDNGQANYILCVEENTNVNISHTTVALCSEYKRGMNQNGNHFQKGIISFNEVNISKSITTRGAAAISTQRSSVPLISYSNIQECISISILDFFFASKPVTIDHTNFIANSNTAQSNLLVFSSNTVLSSCYFERNNGYLTGPSAGPTISIIIKDCYYDMIKFLISSGVQMENCQLIDDNAKQNPVGKQRDACFDENSLKISSSFNYLPYFLYLIGIASILYILVFKFHSIVLLLSNLPGRTRSHSRTRPITHYHV